MKKLRRYFNDPFNNMLSATQYIHPILPAIIKVSKFGNIRIGQFDSLSEYIRFRYLQDLERRGIIKDLKVHEVFVFPDRTYECDFSYIVLDFSFIPPDFCFTTPDGLKVVEDVKSPQLLRSPRFHEARRLMRSMGIEIRVIRTRRLLS